jgi:hypothetical protein
MYYLYLPSLQINEHMITWNGRCTGTFSQVQQRIKTRPGHRSKHRSACRLYICFIYLEQRGDECFHVPAAEAL